MTALRYMTAPDRLNTLAAYVKAGGKLWLLGGGGGYASTIGWNRTDNDVPTTTFSALHLRTAATDPLPPLRTITSQFYPVTAGIEFPTQPNNIRERELRGRVGRTWRGDEAATIDDR